MSVKQAAIDAWIDIGGTFTDCFVREPDGSMRSCKILSSGRVPISIKNVDSLLTGQTKVFSPQLSEMVDDFWTSARLLVLDADGQNMGSLPVVGSGNGWLELAESELSEELRRQAQNLPLFRFELDAILEAPVLGTRRLLECPLNQSLPELRVRLGTTRGTNALLTRSGAKTALAVTAPFADLLEIGDQTRPDLFALDIQKPQPLAGRVVEIPERLASDGNILEPLDEQRATQALTSALDAGCESLAICLLHSYLNPIHERQLEQLARRIGFTSISVSSQLAPLIEVVARAQTTVVDAYLSPIVSGYLQSLFEQFCAGHTNSGSLHVMTSAGGLVDWRQYSGKDSILSGPAGGVRALGAIAAATNKPDLIGLDMGGTSTDVCRVTPEEQLQYESSKAGVRILTPTLPIETVAAGGGSVCWFDGVSFRVGPQSAGSVPGPACYGRGGPLTLTDLNVYLDRVPAEQFPFELDQAAILKRLQEVQAACEETLGRLSPQELAEGFRRLAGTQMAEAVRSVTIAQGADPRHHTLVGFGGAAGQHICEVAELLGITTIVDSAEAGLLSALGMGVAEQRADDVFPVYENLADCEWQALQEQTQLSISQLESQLEEQGATRTQVTATLQLEMRYVGTDATLTVTWELTKDFKADELSHKFHRLHREHFGYQRAERDVELVAIRIQCQTPGVHQLPSSQLVAAHRQRKQESERPIWQRQDLEPGDRLWGPAIICNVGSTLVLDRGWQASVRSEGTLWLEHVADQTSDRHSDAASPNQRDLAPAFDPVFRDCYAARLMAIASQMGLVLQQTAVSVNVKRRRDFSCAIFDATGQLLANAPHVPVHLGAMGQTVRSMLDHFPDMRAGESFVTNDPYRGGSHLPDITVITPVFTDAGQLGLFVASRAHHADIGGISPGSMSVTATRLGQEGVLIPPMRIRSASNDADPSDLEHLAAHLKAAPLPPRDINQNLADVAAQVAANQRGLELLHQYAEAEGWPRICNYSQYLLDAGDLRVRKFISTLTPESKHFFDTLDDGSPICVNITKPKAERLRISFAGSAPVSETNFNANPSIVTAAIMYVLRCLIADEMPLNEGALWSIEIEIPTGILNPPAGGKANEQPAVAAGNVETSQRVVDVLLGALGAAAASQGTMNNLLFGNERFGFYETICGGAGATKQADGASAVHTHMTNTRLTDPEVLEAHYPIRLIQFCVRQGSGGVGTRTGGDGVIREIAFLERVTCSLLTSRRGNSVPFGLNGGSPGSSGRNWLIGKNDCESLPACCQFEATPGMRLRLETPGGGGFGSPPGS